MFRIRTQRNQRIGTNENTLMMRMTRNRKTGTSQSTFQIQMPRNPKIGMMKWMVNGSHRWLTILNTRVNGNQNRRKIQITRFLSMLLFHNDDYRYSKLQRTTLSASSDSKSFLTLGNFNDFYLWCSDIEK